MSMHRVESPAPTAVNWQSGEITGQGVQESVKTLGELPNVFIDEAAWQAMDPKTVVYRVRLWKPIAEGTTGGLFWGSTILQPGRVGNEFFMTHGHFHAQRDRAEYYATVAGKGALLLMNETGETWSQAMAPGSVHYIPGHTAHRVINTGAEPLTFLASWPSDAGYEYGSIRTSGFGKRMLLQDGEPVLV